MTIPCFSTITPEFKPVIANKLIDFNGSGVMIKEPAETLNPDGSITEAKDRGNVQLLFEPIRFNETWGAIADMSITGQGKYLFAGVSAKTNLSANTAISFSLTTGYEWTQKSIGLGTSFKFVNRWQNEGNFIVELDAKSNGHLFWYSARMSFQVFPVLGLGIRAQKNSLIGPYFQVGHDDCFYFWFSTGYEESFKKLGTAAGIKIAYPFPF